MKMNSAEIWHNDFVKCIFSSISFIENPKNYPGEDVLDLKRIMKL